MFIRSSYPRHFTATILPKLNLKVKPSFLVISFHYSNNQKITKESLNDVNETLIHGGLLQEYVLDVPKRTFDDFHN